MGSKSIRSDVVISYISMFIALVLSFVLTKIEVDYLGPDMFGVLSLINSTVGYIAILDMGVGQTVIRYISKFNAEGKKEKVNQLAGHSFKNYLKISVVGLVIGIVIVIFSGDIFSSLSGESIEVFKIGFFIALLNVILQIPGATFNAVLSAYKEFRILKITNIIKSILRAIMIFILLYLGFGIISVFVIDIILNQGINIFNYIYMKKKLGIKLDFTPMDKSFKKELVGYSFFIFLGIITDQIFWKTDTILLGIMSTSVAVSVYAISGQLISQYLVMCSTFSSVFLPRIVEKLAQGQTKQEINRFFTKASRYQYIFVGMVLVSYIFVGKDFILLWLGNHFINAYYYGLIIMISLTVPMFQTTGYQILYAMNKHKMRAMIYLFNAILNLVLSIILLQLIGTVGAAIATSIAMVIGNTIIINIYYKKVLELNLMKFFKDVCLKTTISMVITSVLYIVLNNFIGLSWIEFILKASIANIVYLIAIWKISINKKERNMVKKLVESKLYNSEIK